jgi:hypothetical protein
MISSKDLPNGSTPMMQIVNGELAEGNTELGHSVNLVKFNRNAALT